ARRTPSTAAGRRADPGRLVPAGGVRVDAVGAGVGLHRRDEPLDGARGTAVPLILVGGAEAVVADVHAGQQHLAAMRAVVVLRDGRPVAGRDPAAGLRIRVGAGADGVADGGDDRLVPREHGVPVAGGAGR